MPQKPQHEQGDEADVIRWFKALGPPPQGRAAPHLRASVLAQIAQRRARRGLWAWLPRWRPAVWVPVLAAGLVLSLAVNIWWGIDRRGVHQPLPATEGRPVHAYRLLHTIQSPKAIGSLVASHSAVEAQFVGLGFALQDPRVIIFRMGILYTDALAALHSGTLDVATRRVYALSKALQSLQAPPLLSHYLTEIHTLLQNQQYGDDRLAFVLGHEIAHQLKDDFWHLKFFQALAAAKAQQPQQRQPLAEVEAFFRAPQEERPAQELRADEHGIIYATMAGFNPQAVVTDDPQTNFFQDWIQARAPRHVGLGLSASSHPNPTQRAAALRAHLQQIADKVSVFEVGLWFYYAGDYAKAVQAFEQFLAFFPSREVYHNLAVSHHQLALQAYQVWHKEPPVLPFHLSLTLDPLTRANEVFLGRLLTAERSATGAAQPAQLFRRHLQQAITLYRQALTHDETYLPAATNLGCALLVRGVRAEGGVRHADVYEAVATLQRALERAPNVPALLNNLAVALFYVDQVPRARSHLTQARTFAPDYTAPVFNLAYIAQTEKRYAEAQQYQRDYAQLVSRQPTALPASSQGMEHVLGLGIGSVADQVPLTWGAAVRHTFQLEAMPLTVATSHAQIQALWRDGEILMIFVRQGYGGESARGITIGSGAEDVLGRYGPPTQRLETTQGQSWSYDAQHIAFQLHQGKVVSWLLF